MHFLQISAWLDYKCVQTALRDPRDVFYQKLRQCNKQIIWPVSWNETPSGKSRPLEKRVFLPVFPGCSYKLSIHINAYDFTKSREFRCLCSTYTSWYRAEPFSLPRCVDGAVPLVHIFTAIGCCLFALKAKAEQTANVKTHFCIFKCTRQESSFAIAVSYFSENGLQRWFG